MRALVFELIDHVADKVIEMETHFTTKEIQQKRHIASQSEPLLATHHQSKSYYNIENKVSLLGKCEKTQAVEQWKYLQQHDKVSCGYYCLFAATQILKKAQVKNRIELTDFEHGCRVSYYWNQARWLKLIIDHAKNKNAQEDWYPWGVNCIKSMVLERPYLKYLIKHDPEIQSLGGSRAITDIPEMSLDSLGNGFLPMETIFAIQKTCEEFHKQKTFHHAFIIGATNHWVLFIICKFDEHSNPQGIYIDSENNFILNKSFEELSLIAKTYYDNKKKPVPDRPTRERRFCHSLQSAQFAIETLMNAVNNKKTFAHTCAEQELLNIVAEWKYFAKEYTEWNRELFIKFLREYTPPAQIRSKLRRIDTLFSSQPNYSPTISNEASLILGDWLKFVQAFKEADVPMSEENDEESQSTVKPVTNCRVEELETFFSEIYPKIQQFMQI